MISKSGKEVQYTVGNYTHGEKNKKIIKHCGVWVFALITSACLVVILPKVALADPHAMFYTDKGQQQVFYNILAALNQADYVEPPLKI